MIAIKRPTTGVDMLEDYLSYIVSLQKDEEELFSRMEQYAEEHRIPIMDRLGIETFLGLLHIQKPQSILEIGSAIGYSALRMATALKNTTIVTIERDRERYLKAVEYIGQSEMKDRILILEADALESEAEEIFGRQYDALFIDAAKGQYKRFFEKYEPTVKPGGVIYCDNMFMHGMVLLDEEEVPRRNRTMIRKLKEFTRWIYNHPDFETSLLPVGDGILIAVKS
ncbi:O-methyltransferase [Sporosarcina sp. 179-K 3D1 HS]|uniref:O-methyltransferase n=1 Tax=Sporosarcina sp. 179-K 3D1 HS TaxID=3232169 RepID=UPI0039A34E07